MSRPRCARSPFARLREFAAYWSKDARNETCCLFATDDEIRHDLSLYDCETCPVADALASLEEDPANVRAWRIFQRVANRFNADSHATPLLLARLLADLSDDDVIDCLERLAVIYDECCPVSNPKD